MKIVLKIIKWLFLGYAVLFSVAGTAALVYTGSVVLKPVIKVRRLRTENPAETLYMKALRQDLAAAGTADTLQHTFVPLDSISPVLIKAVLAAEDDGFYTHPGFDAAAIARALEHNRLSNGHKRGASTITQQMAKNLFSGGEKTFQRKYEELAYTVLMESFLGKDRILELYMNYAQWGKNIFGCEAAARYYYGKSCRDISVQQAAHLAAVLARPANINPFYAESSLLQKRLTVIANNMYRRRSIDTTTWIELGGDDTLLMERDKDLVPANRPSPSSAGENAADSAADGSRRVHF